MKYKNIAIICFLILLGIISITYNNDICWGFTGPCDFKDGVNQLK